MGEHERTVLIVDDDEALLRGWCRKFRHLARVLPSRAAAEALALAASEPIELAIVDFHLRDGATGSEIVRSLKARAPAPRVAIVSSDLTPDVLEVARNDGADAVLDKSLVEGAILTLLDGTWSDDPAYEDRLDRVIQNYVVRVLARCHGNRTHAAQVLGVSRSTLARYLGSSPHGEVGE